ncbi:MAG TPA: hypothetical protein EYO76_00545, partial [Flavobacteriaceae bacterium]|nr:hypothetical protein [Flavobacteriaceae bacterium]
MPADYFTRCRSQPGEEKKSMMDEGRIRDTDKEVPDLPNLNSAGEIIEKQDQIEKEELFFEENDEEDEFENVEDMKRIDQVCSLLKDYQPKTLSPTPTPEIAEALKRRTCCENKTSPCAEEPSHPNHKKPIFVEITNRTPDTFVTKCLQTQRAILIGKPFQNNQSPYFVNYQNNQKGITKKELAIFHQKTDAAAKAIVKELSQVTTSETASKPSYSQEILQVNAVATRLKHSLDGAALERAAMLLTAQKTDTKVRELYNKVKKFEDRKARGLAFGDYKPETSTTYTFKIKNGILLGQFKEKGWKYVAPESLRRDILNNRHQLIHSGVQGTLHQIANSFIWDSRFTASTSMIQDVEAVVRSCIPCQMWSTKGKYPNQEL